MTQTARFGLFSAAFGAALLCARPAAAVPSTLIYDGDPAATKGIQLAGWGSGMAIEDRTRGGYAGHPVSIRVNTQGPYAGGRIIFTRPLDLTPQFTAPDSRFGFIDFIVQFTPSAADRGTTPGGFGGFPGASGGPGAGFPGGGNSSGGRGRGAGGFPGAGGAGGFPGAGGAGGFPGGGYGRGRGAGGFPGAGGFRNQGRRFAMNEESTPQASKNLRVTLIFDEGTLDAVNYPIVLFPTNNEQGWFSMPISFVAFKGYEKLKGFHLRELRLFGDNKDEVNIGEIRTMTDDEPISVDALENLDVAVNDVVQFTAQASAGISTLKYSWDFDDSDGIQEDATGPSVTHVYRKPKMSPDGVTPLPYIVTLTVSDVVGAKKPEKRTAQITVNP